MISQPKLGPFVAIAFALVIAVMAAADLPSVLYWRIAPEHYLMRVRGFYGQRLLSDEGVNEPPPI